MIINGTLDGVTKCSAWKLDLRGELFGNHCLFARLCVTINLYYTSRIV